MSVKVSIVGCGAIGSIFGAHLARLEEVEVHAYDVNKDHVRAINERGLRISGAADFTVRLHATSDASAIPVCDLGIVATKSTHTRPAIEQTKHIFGPGSAVCSMQNGVGNEEILILSDRGTSALTSTATRGSGRSSLRARPMSLSSDFRTCSIAAACTLSRSKTHVAPNGRS